MFLAAVDLDHVGAFRQVVEHAFVAVQGVAHLIEVGHLELGAVLDGARVRGQPAQQQADQRRLAAAVGAEDADPVAAQQGDGEIPQQRQAVDGVAQMLRFDHHLAGVVALLDFQAGGALAVAAPGVVLAHAFQGAHPAFVTGAARLDALADPALFLAELLVELGVGALFVFQRRLLAGQVLVVIAGPAGQFAAVQLDNAGRQGADEGPVVGNEHQGGGIAFEEGFQPADRVQVQVVGGLVQQQDVRLLDQRPGQQHAAFHAAGQAGEVLLAVQVELGEHRVHALEQLPGAARLDLIVEGLEAGQVLIHALRLVRIAQGAAQVVVLVEQRAQLAQALGDHVVHAVVLVLGHFLFQARDHQVLGALDLAVVGLHLAGQDLEQGGLAGAVAAHQTEPLAGFDGEVDIVEQRLLAEVQLNLSQRDQGHESASF